MQDKLYNKVIEYYESRKWKYEIKLDENDRTVIHMWISTERMSKAEINTVISRNSIITYTTSPVNIPSESIIAVSEYLTRANYGLKIGSFEMDISTGRVSYKVGTVWDRAVLPTRAILERYIDTGFNVFDRYIDAMMMIVHSNISAEEAIKIAERRS